MHIVIVKNRLLCAGKIKDIRAYLHDLKHSGLSLGTFLFKKETDLRLDSRKPRL